MSTAAVERQLDRAWIGLRLVSVSLMLVVLDYVATVLVMQLVPKLIGGMNLPAAAVIMNGAFYVTLTAAVLAIVGEFPCFGLAKQVGATVWIVLALVLAALALALLLVGGFSLTAMVWVIQHLGIDPGTLSQHLRSASYISFLLFLMRVPKPGKGPDLAARARRLATGLAVILVFTITFQIGARRFVMAGGPWALITFLVVDILVTGVGMILFARAASLTNDVRRGLAKPETAPAEPVVTT